MPNEKLEKLKREQYFVEKRLTAAKHKKRQLQSEFKLNHSQASRHVL